MQAPDLGIRHLATKIQSAREEPKRLPHISAAGCRGKITPVKYTERQRVLINFMTGGFPSDRKTHYELKEIRMQ